MTPDELAGRLSHGWEQVRVMTFEAYYDWRGVSPEERFFSPDDAFLVVGVRGPALAMLPIPIAMVSDDSSDAVVDFVRPRLEEAWVDAIVSLEATHPNR